MAVDDDAAADAPLIRQDLSRGPHDGAEEATLLHDDQDSEVRPRHLPPPTAFIWALSATAGISGLLFGYEYCFLVLRS